jgi:lipase
MTAHEGQVWVKTAREAQGRVSGDGIDLAFGYWPGRGAPVVALHGLTASYVSFMGVAERLAGRRAVFALDLRGRGDSDKPAGPYGMVQHARDVASAMRAMGLGPSIIVGHSMGGFIAAALAAQESDLVAGVVFIDGGYAPAIAAAGPQQALDAALQLRITQLRQTHPSREAYRLFWRGQPHFPAEDWGPWVEAFLDYEVGGEAPELRPKASEDGVKADLLEGLQREAMIARLKAIRVPVLMIRAGYASALSRRNDGADADVRSGDGGGTDCGHHTLHDPHGESWSEQDRGPGGRFRRTLRGGQEPWLMMRDGSNDYCW